MQSQSFHSFEAAWNHFHGGYSPITHLMRDAGVKHWQRFHSLPKSKQYPDSKAEMRTVIARANAMAYATLGREDAWLVTWAFEDADYIEPAPEDIRRWLDRNEATQKRRFQRYALCPTGMSFYDEEDRGFRLIHAAPVRWGDRRFVPLLREIALDAAHSTWLWMSNHTGAVFSPYDGGADLFLPTAEQVVQARARWSDWLPAN